jgi:hypothetical protein
VLEKVPAEKVPKKMPAEKVPEKVTTKQMFHHF